MYITLPIEHRVFVRVISRPGFDQCCNKRGLPGHTAARNNNRASLPANNTGMDKDPRRANGIEDWDLIATTMRR
jgi:hypothetical protein